MGFFECCHYCKSPKRHPGCHDKCPDYIESKKLWEERREIEKLSKSGEPRKSAAHMRAIREMYRNQKRK